MFFEVPVTVPQERWRLLSGKENMGFGYVNSKPMSGYMTSQVSAFPILRGNNYIERIKEILKVMY